jgi:lipoyl(octanoyl) transferase
MKICKVQRLGMVPYQAAWDTQNRIAEEVASDARPDTLLLLQHPHTYTFGKRGQSENLLWDEGMLAEMGVEVHWVDRGGDVTYHGPGQLVGYSILRLAPVGFNGERLSQADYIGYIRDLETVLIQTLDAFGITGMRIEGKTGVWVPKDIVGDPRKIGSIGVKVDARGISKHGFALNVDPDSRYWSGIIPCGLDQVEMTSMAVLTGEPIEMAYVEKEVIQAFGEVFDMQMEI